MIIQLGFLFSHFYFKIKIMDIKEIVNRPIDLPFNQTELEYVVEKYVKEKKGQDISISLGSDGFMFGREILLLQSAYDVASNYFKEKYDTTKEENL